MDEIFLNWIKEQLLVMYQENINNFKKILFQVLTQSLSAAMTKHAIWIAPKKDRQINDY